MVTANENTILVNTNGGLIAVQSAAIGDGDNILLFNTPGGQIAYASGEISVGENVLLVNTPGGLIAINDGSVYGSGTGSLPPTTPPTTPPPNNIPPLNCIQISAGFDQDVTEQGQIIQLGNFEFEWNGSGYIYVASSCSANPDTDLIWADDEFDVTSDLGALSVQNTNKGLGGPYPGCHYSQDLLLNSILQEGINSISCQIKDTGGSLIGCSPLYIIQSSNLINPLSQLPPGIGHAGSYF